MIGTLRRACSFSAMLALTACSDGFLGIGESDATFRPDGEAFTLTATNAQVRGEIPFSYTNSTGRTIYVQNCNRIVPPVLEKKIDGAWITVWGAAVPQCLSAPIVIRDGDTYRDTLEVVGGFSDGNVLPKFLAPQIDGTYRMRWENVFWTADHSGYPYNSQIPRDLRTSSEFRIEVEE